MSSLEGRRIVARGIVQGVGFRPWVYRLARDCGVAGRVNNDGNGVTIEAFGAPAALDRFLERLRESPPPAAVLDELTWEAIPPESAPDFVIAASESGGSPRVSIPPDLATCEECLQELFDRRDRRFRYAFINCTNCGPRYTITRDVPYDRPMTTMAAFEMCEACRAEYASPSDRRFHAEPNACPACGPVLRLLGANGDRLDTQEPVEAAALAISAGLIVAVKGLGGFHLACDATAPHAVATLRQRKRRDEKPFAIMVADLDAAERLAVLNDAERRVLESVVRPVVLVPRRDVTRLATEVAPENPLVGVMLPYTPLHHLLLSAVERPLVMTSGNLSEEPLAHRDDEALARLRDVTDLFLTHDRDIEAPCDDSVVRVIGGRSTVLRRARGYVPRPVRLRQRFRVPTLGCGALLKNTFCLARDHQAWLGPHVGDLDNVITHDFYGASIRRFERFLRIRPEVVAHDLHPEYHSTTYARTREGTVAVGVQHHHAHVASAMAEHHLEGPVLGLAWDGTGLGTDGAAWGGELLLAHDDRFERLATFRPVPLAGGDLAIRQVWRIALALVLDAFGPGAPLPALRLFRHLPERDVEVVRQMIGSRLNAPLAHGVGRYFDGFGALGLGRAESRYEGQVAAMWNHCADAHERGQYDWALDRTGTPWVVDLRAAVRTAVEELSVKRAAPVVSARFHNTLVAVGAALIEAAIDARGALPVVLTGGVFQNARLTEGLHRLLARRVPVHLHREIPPGDGGIALGQVVVANALLAR
jgi:hydrogenase maturation protein HypF